MEYLDWASAEADMGADLAGVARAAGGSGAEGTVIWSDGRVYVRGVSQAALDAAMHDHDPTEASRTRLVIYIKDRRWRAENGGLSVEIGGETIRVATDDRSKTLLLGSRLAATLSPENFTTPWSDMDDVTHVLDAAAVVALSDAVLAHVQTVFALQDTLIGSVRAGTITTIEEIDEAFEE